MSVSYFSVAGHLTLCFKAAQMKAGDKDVLLQLGAHIAGLVPIDKPLDTPDIIFEIAYGDQEDFIIKDNHVTLLSSQTQGLPQTAYHLLGAVVRKKLLQDEGLCSIHAACIGQGDSFTLLAGHSGSGKTTISQALLEYRDVSLFAGNKTVLRFEGDGKITAIAGNQTMTALDEKFNRYAYRLPDEKYAAKKTVPVRAIDILKINDGVEECTVLSPLSALHTLYPYVMDAVNADVIVGGHKVFDGSVSQDVKSRISREMACAFEHMTVRKISGSVPYLKRMIHG